MSETPTTKRTLDTDHKRGCAGREYACTCGYDDARDAEIAELTKERDLYKGAWNAIMAGKKP